MSTRCQIHVNETKVFIYKHSDGYPEGVLPTLEPFCRWFMEHRGWDAEYLAAQIVREFARNELTEEPRESGESDLSHCYGEYRQCLGWGLSTELHGDEEFVYVVYKDRIEVRTPTWRLGAPSLGATKLSEKIAL